MINKDSVITMVHGSGGSATNELINEIFASEFSNNTLNQMEDSAVLDFPTDGLLSSGKKLAFTTDSFVVTPLEFRGGDIGRLAICGTVNDLLMRGAVPKYITCGYIIQEGMSVECLKRIVHSMADTAREAGVTIVAGDTKVVDANGDGEPGLFINTAGVGFVPEGIDISAGNAKPGDKILISGNLGDHHAAILSHRMNIETDIESDNAPLGEMTMKLVERMSESGNEKSFDVHTLRDVTRGGLGTVLKELALASGYTFNIYEESVPASAKVRGFCGLLGLDPVYMGNEGKMVAIVPAECADEALEIIKASKYGSDACIIGDVTEDEKNAGELIMHTAIGGRRRLDILQGEGLPRIC